MKNNLTTLQDEDYISDREILIICIVGLCVWIWVGFEIYRLVEFLL